MDDGAFEVHYDDLLRYTLRRVDEPADVSSA